ncbi:retrovirus-related Pol polyprotein from transposon 17.6 [Trichonephila clavipes]|nr:retrovirus-related Pol polyprotein from transposon 17.6 [Trichonephila clavipes]
MHRFQKLECPYRTGCISNAEYDGVEFLSREEKFITVLDMLKGYSSIPMEDNSRHSPDKERIKVIQNLQAPTTKKQLRSALGLCNFYRQYIPNFAKIALLLTELTKKKVPNEIPWSKEAEKCFQGVEDSTMWNYRVAGPRQRNRTTCIRMLLRRRSYAV